jgi:class 3 adenylate cyclase/tetratricopeptide (TPR) repeat protein
MGTTGIVTLLFTDLVGSTDTLARLGEERAEQLRQTHFSLLREAISRTQGTEVKNLGDGLMVIFAAASDAVGCAVAMQQSLERHNRRATEALHLRIGISVGEATCEESDYFGTPVVEAARLCARAEGGQVLVTEMVRALAGSRAGQRFEPLGALELKGLPDPVPVCEVRWETASTAGLPLPPRLAVEPAVAFVGRQAERDVLAQAWKGAQQGSRAVVLIGGEPGMGKTRLATEAARAAHREGATVLLGVCDEDLAVPYQPFVEALRHFLAVAPADHLADRLGERAGELVRLVPELAQRLPGLAPLPAADADTERYLLFEAVAGFLAAASRECPTLLLLDDVHWATKPTLLMLRHVVRSAAALSLLVVVTYRDADLTRTHPLTELLADLRRESGVERVALRGFSDAEAVTFVEAVAGHQMAEDAEVGLAQAVHAESEGNPFFMREILRHLAESGAVFQEDGRWTYRGDVEALGIPESVREVIGRRLSRLSESTGRLLTLGAVIGRSFDLAVLGDLAGMPLLAVIDGIEEAAAAALVREVPGAAGRYTFAHALVRHTLYEELSAPRRMELHRAVGATLESLAGTRRGEYSAELAHHWLAAIPALGVTVADTDKAAEYAEQAGLRAMASLAYEEAVGHFEGALRAVALLGDVAPRARLLANLGEAQRCAGDPAHRDTLLEAGRLALERGDAELAARAALANQRGQYSRIGSVDPERVAALETTLQALGPEDTPARARLLASLASELHFTHVSRPHDLVQEALAVARRLGDPTTVAQVLAAGWFANWTPDNLAERSEIAEELSWLAGELGDRILEFHAGVALYLTAAQRGDLEQADAGLDACIRVAEELGQPVLRWRAAFTRAGRALWAGRLAAAEECGSEALHWGEVLGLPDGLIYGQASIALVRMFQGRTGEAEELMRPLLEDFGSGVGVIRAMVAWSYADLGRIDEARALLEEHRGPGFTELPRDYLWLLSVAVSARVCATLGDAEMAAELTALLLPHRPEMVQSQSIFLGPVAHYLGLLATTLGQLDEANDHFAASVASEERIAARAMLVHTQLEWARTLLLRRQPGDTDQARDLLTAAQAGARELELTGLEPRIAALLADCD